MCVITFDDLEAASSSVCLVSGDHPATIGAELSGASPASSGVPDAAGASGGISAASEASTPRCSKIQSISWDPQPDDVVVVCSEYMTQEGSVPHTSAPIAARHHEIMLRHQNVVERFGEPDL